MKWESFVEIFCSNFLYYLLLHCDHEGEKWPIIISFHGNAGEFCKNESYCKGHLVQLFQSRFIPYCIEHNGLKV